MKMFWVGALALALSTAVWARVATRIVDMPKFDTLALIYKQSAPHALIAAVVTPSGDRYLAEYVRLHNTRMEDAPEVSAADCEAP